MRCGAGVLALECGVRAGRGVPHLSGVSGEAHSTEKTRTCKERPGMCLASACPGCLLNQREHVSVSLCGADEDCDCGQGAPGFGGWRRQAGLAAAAAALHAARHAHARRSARLALQLPAWLCCTHPACLRGRCQQDEKAEGVAAAVGSGKPPAVAVASCCAEWLTCTGMPSTAAAERVLCCAVLCRWPHSRPPRHHGYPRSLQPHCRHTYASWHDPRQGRHHKDARLRPSLVRPHARPPRLHR